MPCGVITLILLLSLTIKRVAETPTTSFGKNKLLTDSHPKAIVSNYPTDKAINRAMSLYTLTFTSMIHLQFILG